MENNILLSSIKIDELESLIQRVVEKALIKNASSTTHTSPDLLTFKQACDLLGLSSSSIYNLVSQRRIPHSKKGKRLYFSRVELVSWINSGRRKTDPDQQN